MATSVEVRGRMDGRTFVEPVLQSIKTSRGSVEAAVWGEGPAVLALHGAMGGYDQGVLLARTGAYPEYRFIALSRPGYLGTPLSMGRTPQEQADLCAEALDALQMQEVAVIAISGGGPTALQFALRHPDRCQALVMISACSETLYVPPPLRWYIMKLMAHIPFVTRAMRRKLEQDPESAAQRSIRDDVLRRRTLDDPEVGPLFRALQLSVMDRMAQRLAGSENDIRQTRAEMRYPLESITAPTLIVHGTSDAVVPFEQAESLAGRVPGAELMRIEGGEHVSIFTHREVIRERVSRLLSASQR